MNQRRTSETLVRQWQLVASLGASPLGCTVRQLTEQLRMSRSTLYRDLLSLRAAGVAVESTTISGKVHLRLPEAPHHAVAPSPLQLAALKLARRSLASVEGTSGVQELDALLARWSAPTLRSVRAQRPPSRSASLAVQWVETALARGDDLVLAYREDDGWSVVQRRVTPLAWAEHSGKLCLLAVDADDWTTCYYQAARIVRIECAKEQPLANLADTVSSPFAQSSDKIEVEVRLAARLASFVVRHPLGDGQTVEPDTKSTLIVRAFVPCLRDARRWVLSWGADAEALAPDALRADLAEEAHRMDTLYWRRPFGPAKASNPTDAALVVTGLPGSAAVR
jgi:predicted DNA-binding transcriptional regulator YafY